MKNIDNWKLANKMAAKGMLTVMAINLVLSLLFTQILELSSLKLLAVVLIVEFIAIFYYVEKKLI